MSPRKKAHAAPRGNLLVRYSQRMIPWSTTANSLKRASNFTARWLISAPVLMAAARSKSLGTSWDSSTPFVYKHFVQPTCLNPCAKAQKGNDSDHNRSEWTSSLRGGH